MNNKNKIQFVTIIYILLLLTIIYLIKNITYETFIQLNKNVPSKKASKNIKIPKKIWQTHESSDFPQKSYDIINNIINNNPEYDYHFYDKDDRYNFIKNNFDKKVLKAYEKINSGAGKSDIWRLAILLKEGGIYFDSDFKLSKNSKPFIDIIDEDDQFIHGRGWHVWGFDAPYPNGVLCSTPNHPVIKYAFDSVIDSIINDKPIKNIGKYKGWADLECYTGTPHLWKAIIEYTGEINLKEGKYKHGINISDKIMNNLFHDYSNDLTELSTGGEHWMNQKTFTNKEYFNNNTNKIICFLTVKPTELFYNECKKLLNNDYKIFICIDDNNYYIPNYDNQIPIIKIDNKESEDNGFKNTVTYCKDKACSRDKALYYFSRIYKNNYKNIWFIKEDVFFYDINTIKNIDKKYNGDLLCKGNIIIKNSDMKDTNMWMPRVLQETKDILTYPYSTSMVCAIRVNKKLLNLINNYAEKNNTLFFCEYLFTTLALQNKLKIDTPIEFKYINCCHIDINKINNKEYLYHPIKDIETQVKLRQKIFTNKD